MHRCLEVYHILSAFKATTKEKMPILKSKTRILLFNATERKAKTTPRGYFHENLYKKKNARPSIKMGSRLKGETGQCVSGQQIELVYRVRLSSTVNF